MNSAMIELSKIDSMMRQTRYRAEHISRQYELYLQAVVRGPKYFTSIGSRINFRELEHLEFFINPERI